jgi:tRNA dimethylallyltransferase
MYDWLDKTTPVFKENEFLKLYINVERQELIKRINERVLLMVKKGAIREVQKFISLKIKKDQTVNKVIGIDELTQYLQNKINLEQAIELISIKTRQYAKRQATWARTRMTTWDKISLNKIDAFVKKLDKSSLKLDQLT